MLFLCFFEVMNVLVKERSIETLIQLSDGPELDPREKALTALALRSLANHFILDRPTKKQINLTYRPNVDLQSLKLEDARLLQQQRFVAVRCR